MHHGDVSPEIAQVLLAFKKRINAAKIPSSWQASGFRLRTTGMTHRRCDPSAWSQSPEAVSSIALGAV